MSYTTTALTTTHPQQSLSAESLIVTAVRKQTQSERQPASLHDRKRQQRSFRSVRLASDQLGMLAGSDATMDKLPSVGIMMYRADITAGSLKVAESRAIASLLLKGADEADWKISLEQDNILQTRSPATARRVARLIRNRLETMTPELWTLVRDGNATVATHACLAAAVKHSRLLADFFELVVREQARMFAKTLPRSLWNDFIANCQARDSGMQTWSPATLNKLRTTTYHILEQAGYIDSTKSLRLQKLHIASEVVSYLSKHNEDTVLSCLQVTP